MAAPFGRGTWARGARWPSPGKGTFECHLSITEMCKVRWLACEVARREVLLLFLATPLLLFPRTWSPAGLAILALIWGCRRLARGSFSSRTATDVPIVLLLVFGCISLVPSVDLALSPNRMSVLILGVALFCGMVNGIDDQRSLQAMGTGLVGLAVAVISLLSTDFEAGRFISLPVVYDHLPPPLIRGLPGSGVLEQYDLVNPRLVAGTLAILLPIPLGYLTLGYKAAAAPWVIIKSYAARCGSHG
jgi:hypothetical protein